MTITEEVLAAICQRAAGTPLTVVDAREVGAALRLTLEELRTSLQALEVTGLVQYEGGAAGPTAVRLTPRGAEQCAQSS